MPAGRPTKFDEKYTQMLIDYFDREPGMEREVENSKGNMQLLWSAANFPTLAGFAVSIGVARSTIWEWATHKDENGNLSYPEFSNAYNRAADFQEYILTTNALKGGYNANFSIFTAKNVLGWRDKQELEHSGNVIVEVVKFGKNPHS